MLTTSNPKNQVARTHSAGTATTATRRVALFVLLLGGLVVAASSPVLGSQSVTLAWNPVINANVASYNIYYGSASRNYTNVTSVGNVTNATISGLTEGATYYFATTTLDTSGLESVYSSELAYTVPNGVPGIQVTPGNLVYETLLVGTSVTNIFTVQNVGTGTLSGSATVSAPFSVVSGGSYSLATGQTQAVMVAFSPSAASNYNQSVSFSGGTGTNVTVNGSATNSLVLGPFVTNSSPMIITEKITANINNPITLQFTTNLTSPTWRTLGVFASSTNVSFTNMPAVFIRGICSNLTGSVSLAWQPSTDPLLSGYKIYYGTASQTYTTVVTVGTVTTATISNLAGGKTYYFVVMSYDGKGLTSQVSAEIMAVPQTSGFSLTTVVK